MAFLEEEIENLLFKYAHGILGTGNRSTAPHNFTWYEEYFSLFQEIDANLVYDFSLIPEAKDSATAVANAAASPNLIRDCFSTGKAIRLTPSPNQRVFFATEVFGDLSTRIRRWIRPQNHPRTDAGFKGMPSIGYMVRVYNGNPDQGGTEITTSVEQEGARTGWTFHFGSGALIVAASFNGIVDPYDVWIRGFVYVGPTASTSGMGVGQFESDFFIGDWVGDTAPYYIRWSPVQHLQGLTKNLVVTTYQKEADSNRQVFCDVLISSTGFVTIYSNEKFNGNVIISRRSPSVTSLSQDLLGTIGIVVDNGENEITIGIKEPAVIVPYNCRLYKWQIISDVSGSIVVDVLRRNMQKPSSSDSIVGDIYPNLNNQMVNFGSNLSGWEINLMENDILMFRVLSVMNIHKFTLILSIRRV